MSSIISAVTVLLNKNLGRKYSRQHSITKELVLIRLLFTTSNSLYPNTKLTSHETFFTLLYPIPHPIRHKCRLLPHTIRALAARFKRVQICELPPTPKNPTESSWRAFRPPKISSEAALLTEKARVCESTHNT